MTVIYVTDSGKIRSFLQRYNSPQYIFDKISKNERTDALSVSIYEKKKDTIFEVLKIISLALKIFFFLFISMMNVLQSRKKIHRKDCNTMKEQRKI